MIVPICIDLIHFNKKAHLYMYLKYADLCRKYNWPLIADEFFCKWEPANQGEKNAQLGIAERWMYEYMDVNEREKLDQYMIPSAMMEEIVERNQSRLDGSLTLQLEDYDPLVELLEDYVVCIEKKYNEKIEAFLILEKVLKSVETVAKRHNIEVLGIGKGPLRSYGYRDTAYINFGDVYGTDECENRYNQFRKEWDNGFELFDNKELLALFLSKDLLPYLKLYDMEPTRKMLVVGTYTLMPTLFSKTTYSDIEVLREVQELYPGQYAFRPNPADPYESYYHLPPHLVDKESPNILSILKTACVASMGSNMLFDTMLWGRKACTRGKLFPFSFMCQDGYSLEEEKEVPIEFLNFFCFGYLAPFEYMCDREYLNWRLEKPDELEIFYKNLNTYLTEINITEDILKLPREERLRAILACRGVDSDISISCIPVNLSKKAVFSTLTDNMGNEHISINTENKDGIICSTFKVSRSYTNQDITFKPVSDKNASIMIKSCVINGKVSKFRPVGKCVREKGIDMFFDCEPEYVVNGDFSNCVEMKISWKLVQKVQHSSQNEVKYFDKETAEKLELLNHILNSKSWKLLEPFRKLRFKQLNRNKK